jgi:hypothetical protein
MKDEDIEKVIEAFRMYVAAPVVTS